MTPAKPKPAPPRRRRRILSTLVVLLLLLAGAHGLAWWRVTGMMAAGFADWTALRRAEGWTVEHDPPRPAGWPLAAELVVPNLRVEARGRGFAEAVGHDSERLVLRVGPRRLDRLALRWEGQQVLRLGAVAVPVAARRLEAEVPLEPMPPLRPVEVLAEDLTAATPAGLLQARQARLLLSPAWSGAEPALLAELRADGVRMPAGAVAPAVAAALGQEVESVGIVAALTGPSPMPPSAQRARAWRDAGGQLDVRSMALRWGPVASEANVRLSLDAALQPQGSGQVRVIGAPAAIQALEGAGLLPRATARAAQGVVALLTRVPPGGGPPQVELPIALTEGRLSIARIVVATIPPLVWP
ncbi:DUF2125 domain-containing protein [Roseomonas sp. JC162]|uniref:DUF2125 domain-containing protein n=1 Tax=Neoroseomonas marina TaxID=1232220 RepID=A0A848E8Z0_9PROT|nr:DUF2125 domain-containing protein [Neoroseomonas marina]